MKLRACAVLAVVLALAGARGARACWWWTKATAAHPLPSSYFRVNPNTGNQQGSIAYCFCDGGMPGGLYKSGSSYVCAYTDTNTYGYSGCSIGSYYVLTQTFPTSDNPHLVNTTSSSPLPPNPVPPPAEAHYKGYHLCAGRVRNLAPDGELLAGALGPTPNGPLGCLVSKGYNLGGVSQILTAGQYKGLSGSQCAFPSDDDDLDAASRSFAAANLRGTEAQP